MHTYTELCKELGVGVRGVNEMTNDEIAETMCEIFDRHMSAIKTEIHSIKTKSRAE